MNKTGLIWNNEYKKWSIHRTIFEQAQFLLKKLNCISIVIKRDCSILELVRDYTIAMTMDCLLEVDPDFEFRFRAKGIVGNYFKAWNTTCLMMVKFKILQTLNEQRWPCVAQKGLGLGLGYL
jgi:hypothetical protein